MEPVFRPRPGVADSSRILDSREEFLGVDRGGVVERVVVGPGTLCEGGVGRVEGVEGYEDGPEGRGGDVLEEVHPVGQAD